MANIVVPKRPRFSVSVRVLLNFAGSAFESDATLDASAPSNPNADLGDRIVHYGWDLDNDGQFDYTKGMVA